MCYWFTQRLYKQHAGDLAQSSSDADSRDWQNTNNVGQEIAVSIQTFKVEEEIHDSISTMKPDIVNINFTLPGFH